MKVLGIIPARASSKGIPGKNVRLLAGKSLIERAWDCARASNALARVILSTDSDEIAAIAGRCGLEVPFLRPPELARDDSPMIDVAVHALDTLARGGHAYDAVMILQPTSPLRRPSHIRDAIALLPEHDAVCSVSPLPKDLCPHYLVRITDDGLMDYFMPDGARYTRRQDVPQAYRRCGTIFLTRSVVVRGQRSFYGARCAPLMLPPNEVLNIDEPGDWVEAERRLGGE